MKKIFVTSALLLLSSALFLNESMSLALPQKVYNAIAKFNWVSREHDFGKIPQGIPVTAEFKFTNSGNANLVISDARGSCGCTVPSWPKEPIAPGKTGVIKATFNAAAAGPFTKTVTVMANTESGSEVLTIRGEVVASQTGK